MLRIIKNNRCQLKTFLFLALGVVLFLSCGRQPYVNPSCTLPSGVNLEQALDHAKKDLAHLECEILFDSYFERLVDVAQRDPALENKRRFSDFLQWANTEGIIDKIQARSYYNRYFNTTFMSLPDEYNVCSSCSESKQKDLEYQLEEELGQKEVGLLRACQDKNAYYLAADQYNAIMLLLDATCTACRK